MSILKCATSLSNPEIQNEEKLLIVLYLSHTITILLNGE
jgi:hypothetical protein